VALDDEGACEIKNPLYRRGMPAVREVSDQVHSLSFSQRFRVAARFVCPVADGPWDLIPSLRLVDEQLVEAVVSLSPNARGSHRLPIELELS